jgi:hypothetical protein
MLKHFLNGAATGVFYLAIGVLLSMVSIKLSEIIGDFWAFAVMGAVIVVACGLLAMKSGGDK